MGSPKTTAVPSGSLRVCVWVRNWEWELVCTCVLGLGALASDWVFREQRGVRKARQWSNRISSLWWMVCESSTDSSLSQTHTTVSASKCVCARLHASPTGSRTFCPCSESYALRMEQNCNTLTHTSLSVRLWVRPIVWKTPTDKINKDWCFNIHVHTLANETRHEPLTAD